LARASRFRPHLAPWWALQYPSALVVRAFFRFIATQSLENEKEDFRAAGEERRTGSGGVHRNRPLSPLKGRTTDWPERPFSLVTACCDASDADGRETRRHPHSLQTDAQDKGSAPRLGRRRDAVSTPHTGSFLPIPHRQIVRYRTGSAPFISSPRRLHSVSRFVRPK
jgi:hypothetical protein